MITERTIEELIDSPELSPLPLEVIPNFMGINLCSVEKISWIRQTDGQLTNLMIHFIPNSDFMLTREINKQ
jgi:hypothetical protein